MSIITFVNNSKEQTGKTMSIAAIATYTAIEHNYRMLIVSTTNEEDDFKRCFWEEKKQKINMGIFGPNNSNLENANGIDGLVKLSRSNKILPNIITNYTKVVFKDRLEILLGSEENKDENDENTLEEKPKIDKFYPDIIKTANQYYDLVLVDLDENIEEEVRKTIINASDIIVINLTQKLRSLEKFNELREQNELLKSNKVLILLGRYDKFSKYNIKNISRFLGEKNQVLTIPYNTLFFEASGEAGVPDLFLRFRKSIDPEDRNAFFISEVKRTAENIIYRLQDLKMR